MSIWQEGRSTWVSAKALTMGSILDYIDSQAWNSLREPIWLSIRDTIDDSMRDLDG